MPIIQKLSKYYEEAYQLGHFPSIPKLLANKKIYAYYGFLGDRNYGDELVFESAQHLFAPDIVLPVRRRMPVHLALMAKNYKSRFAGVIIGGGTLIGPSFYSPDFFEAMLELGKPIFMHGTGVQKQPVWNAAWKQYLKGKIYGGVRGPKSVANMSGFKEAVPIVGDASFAMFDRASANTHREGLKTILINCGAHDGFDGVEESRRGIEEFVSNALKAGYAVEFMPCHFLDVELAHSIQRRLPQVKLLPVPKLYSEALAYFRKATFAVGERLHFTAMGMLTGCPFLSINYSAKHEDLLASVSLAEAGVAPAKVSGPLIQSAFDQRGSFDWDTAFTRIENFKSYQMREMQAFRSFAG